MGVYDTKRRRQLIKAMNDPKQHARTKTEKNRKKGLASKHCANKGVAQTEENSQLGQHEMATWRFHLSRDFLLL